MELTHTFTVPASVEDTWTAFNDLEMVGGCFPGATVTSVEGDDFKGTCKVKLGPVSLLYTGEGSFLERDEDAYRFVIEAKGKDKRGNGTASATVTAVLSPAGAEATSAEVRTDLAITGKPAQFGRSVIQDVSDKLLGQFMACLESRVTAPAAPEAVPAAEAAAAAAAGVAGVAAVPEGAAPAGPEAGAGPAGAGPAAGAGLEAGAGAGRHAEPGVHRAPTGENDVLDLGATVLPVLLKSYWKQIAGAILVLLVLRRLVQRRRRRRSATLVDDRSNVTESVAQGS